MWQLKRNRLILVGLAVMAMLFVLACQGPSTTPTAPAPTTSAPPTTTKPPATTPISSPTPATSPTQTKPASQVVLRLVTCGVGGTSYVYAATLSSIVEKYNPGLKVVTMPSGCYFENAKMLMEKSVEEGYLSPDIADDLYQGRGQFEGKAYKDMRSMWVTYSNYVHLIVLADSPFKTLADLKGKRVGTYTKGSGTYVILERMFQTYGFSYKDVQAKELGVKDLVTGMKDGTLDFIIVGRGVPDADVTDLVTARKIRLLPFPKEQFDKLMQGLTPGTYLFGPLKGGTYSGLSEDVPSVLFPNLLLAQASIPEDVIYQQTKTFFEHIDEAKATHRVFEETQPWQKPDLPVPMHPGVIKYFKERGWL